MKTKLLSYSAILFGLLLSSFTPTKNNNKFHAYLSDSTVDGKSIFLTNGCTACHSNSQNSIGPSMRVIADAYKNKKDQLIKFLKKESDPIIEPENYAIMAANLFATKKMNKEEIEALASYMLRGE